MEKNEVNNRTSLLVDEPIKSPEQDRLNRVQFAEHLAGVLFEHESSKCLIAAINGEWGCGKSSILNLVESYLVKKRNDNRDIIVLRFNPWNASDVGQLTAMFFRELKMSIMGVDKKQKAKENIIQLLDIFSGILTVAQLSPIGNQFFRMGSALTDKVSGVLKDTPKKTQEEIKRQLDQMLKEYAKRIFIIINDIDRLDIDAMKLLFRLIRLNANFENATYLLAFDRNLIEDVLECEQPGHGKEYVDKIVQVPINVPSPDEGLLSRMLLEALDILIGRWGKENFDRKHWEELYLDGSFRKYFKTMRNVVRYVNGLEITYPLVSSEVDMVDFMGLNLIRTFAAASYEMIRRNKDILTGRETSAFGRQSNELVKEILDRVYNPTSMIEGGEKEKELASLVKSTCKVLFPKISSIEEKFGYGGNWEREWRHKKRICSKDYFDKYFILGTPSNEISDEEMRLFISMAGDAEGFYKKLIEFFDRKVGRRLLERLEDYIHAIDEGAIESVIIAIFNAEDIMAVERNFRMIMGTRALAGRIVYLLLSRIQGSERRKEILISTIEKCQKVYLPVFFVSYITLEGKEDDERSQRALLGFSASDLSEIRRKCVDKIRSFVEEEKLSKAPCLEEILYRWREWEDVEVVKNYVAKLVSTDEGLWEFLIGFTREVFSTEGDYKIIRPKSVGEFADYDNIEKRIKKIIVERGNELTDKEKEVVDALEKGKRRGSSGERVDDGKYVHDIEYVDDN